MKASPMKRREDEWKLHERFRDNLGQCHFPPIRIGDGQMDVVKLGKTAGYYPKMGEKK